MEEEETEVVLLLDEETLECVGSHPREVEPNKEQSLGQPLGGKHVDDKL